jgi:hypothetical protein
VLINEFFRAELAFTWRFCFSDLNFCQHLLTCNFSSLGIILVENQYHQPYHQNIKDCSVSCGIP